MADDQSQQTRVLLLNGQTLILQDASENAINEINADLLQQALQDASATTDAMEEPAEEEYSASANSENNEENNLVAVFQGDQGETHTVQLTVEQAEALGLHFMADEVKNENSDNLSVANPQITIPSEENQLVYPENAIESNEEKSLFDQCVNTQTSIDNLSQNTALPDDSSSTLQHTIAGMEVLPGVANYIGDSNNITLVSQMVNGQMTYTVKMNENQNQLQNRDFPVMEEGGDLEDENLDKKQKIPLITSMPASPVSSVSSSASPVVATSLSNIHLNSISSTANALQPNVSLPKCTPGTSLLARTTGSPVQKTSYVFVPTTGPSSTAGTPVGKQGTTHLLRTANRTQMPPPPPLQPARPSASTSTNSASNTALTGIPLMNSNINITRTSSSSSGLLQSTSITGGGMIRVVAGGSATRIVPTTSGNGPKFTNILTPSGRLVAASSVGTSTQRIIAVNTTANSTKTVAVTTSAVPAVQVTTGAVLPSSAVDSSGTVAQSTPARVSTAPSAKPLGSSENPIQLVQHGQTFHSVQALSQEQLRQIATVLQQQHLDSAPRTKNVLYDAETNTRIIYRVVYPEDLDLREPTSPSERALSSSGVPRGRGRRGRPPKSMMRPFGRGSSLDSSSSSTARKQSVDIDLDEDRLADDTSKGERKKQVARTRSGRLSRPPRHMVKDYKRLHHLDFADADLDDSDGGYSDYQMSDRETEEVDSSPGSVPFTTTAITTATSVATTGGPTESTTTTTATAAVAGAGSQQLPEASTGLLPGLQTTKRKISSHFRCPTCQKVYLGHTRMARHFEVYPDHGSIEQLNVPDKVSHHSTMNGVVRTGSGRRRGKRRGPWAHLTPEARSERRKIKLREVLTTCEGPEVLEVAGPSVASVASMWELLQLRIETIRDESLITTLCDELRALLEKVQTVVGDVLQPASDSTKKEDLLDLQDEMLCNALGLPCGQYEIVDDQLLSRRGQMGYDAKVEPLNKRLKLDENSIEGMEEERKPSCPEVLSALALDPKPTSATIIPLTAAPSAEMKENRATAGSGLQSAQISLKDNKPSVENKTESVPEVDPQFLLPSTTEMCVDGLAPESEGQGQDLQTVDDIVNERLKNLTGFAVNGPEPDPTPPAVGSAADTEVPTFDPEMALAAMGEGDQNVSGTSLSEFEPEIALAAMGEGSEESETSTSDGHSEFATSTPISSTGKNLSLDSNSNAELQQEVVNTNDAAAQIFSSDLSIDVRASQSIDRTKDIVFTTSVITNSSENSFITSLAPREQDIGKCNSSEPVQSVESFDPEIALAAMGEGDGTAVGTEMHPSSTFDTEMALASMGEGSAPEPPQFQPPASTPANDPEFQLTGMDVSLDGSGPELDFETLSAEFTQTTRHS